MKAPDGFVLTGEYRPPKEGEWCSSNQDGVSAVQCDFQGATTCRLILRRVFQANDIVRTRSGKVVQLLNTPDRHYPLFYYEGSMFRRVAEEGYWYKPHRLNDEDVVELLVRQSEDDS